MQQDETANVVAVNRCIAILRDAGTNIDYETVLEKMYRKFIREGDTILDVGAHSGRHLGVFVELTGSAVVHAFEPLPVKLEELRAQFGDNERVVIHDEALTTAAGEATFKYATNVPSESGLKERQYNVEDAGVVDITVRTNALDNYIDDFEKVDYIKMDIEGGEMDCLDGGAKFIDKFRPVISVEYGYPSYSKYDNTLNTLFDWAMRAGYAVFDLFGNEVHDAGEWGLVCDTVYWDYFLVPAEKRPFFRACIEA